MQSQVQAGFRQRRMEKVLLACGGEESNSDIGLAPHQKEFNICSEASSNII